MADTERLIAFIQAAKHQQIGDEFIVALLRQRGWSDNRIYQAFSEYYEDLLGQPIPSRGSRIEGAREAFLYLLAFITLGIWVVALILLADQLIDHAFPSPVEVTYYSRLDVAGQLAALIVAFPLFLFVTRLINKEIERRPEALESGVRKWLTYIALVITAITLLGDGVAVIKSFLNGDLTIRFLLQAAVLFVIAGAVFWYYLGNMRPEGLRPSRDRAFAWAAIVAVCSLAALGFAWTGSPAHQRSIGVDERRIGRLSRIADSLHSLASSEHKDKSQGLPSSLDAVPSLTADEVKDPVSGAAFEYRPTGGTMYQLCAVFDAESTPQIPMVWAHPAGHHCYDLDATAATVYDYGQEWND